MKLEQKAAIVTGGSGGIGEAICLRLASEGMKVVVNCRSHHDTQDTKEKIEQIGSQAHIVKADLGKVEQIDNLVKESIDRSCGNWYSKTEYLCRF